MGLDAGTMTALWGAVILSGLYHGVNPGMGWPLAVSSALMERAPGSLWRALLALAGAYQFSPAKEACLSKCRRPLAFFMAHWDEGPLRNGLRLGLVCLGCCWALMALAFVGGVMNLAFMGLATVIMGLEKLPDIGRWLTRPLGVALLAGAGWTLATTI